MRVEILLFASLRELGGASSVAVEVEAGATIGDLLQAIREQHPNLSGALPGVRVAVGREFGDPATPLAPGAEVALIPPVSGG